MSLNKYEIGTKNLEKIIGSAANRTRDMLSGDFGDIEKYILEFVFGDIYERDGLSLKNKEMITLSTLIAQGAAESQVKLHMMAAMRLGLTKQELIELIIQCIPNVGFPKALSAIAIAKSVIDS